MRQFRPPLIVLLALVVVAGCKRHPPAPPPSSPTPVPEAVAETAAASPGPHVTTLTEARRGFQTHLVRQDSTGALAPLPPLDLFRMVKYSKSELPAYVTLDPKPGAKHPAIIWLVGGFSNSIGETNWQPGPPDNDQSASAFREAGIVTMYPALRGGNDSHAFKEGFYGEVDDVLEAADYLAKVDYVDPHRIYLGGHSTGGTLALLTSESTDRFRAVFSFGPMADVGGYGAEAMPFDISDRTELELRAPGRFLESIRSSTFVFEGTGGRSNILSLRLMMKAPHPDTVHFYPVSGVDHFGILYPMTRVIARKVLADTGPQCNISFSDEDLTLPARAPKGSPSAGGTAPK